jgi:hypothetical protein
MVSGVAVVIPVAFATVNCVPLRMDVIVVLIDAAMDSTDIPLANAAVLGTVMVKPEMPVGVNGDPAAALKNLSCGICTPQFEILLWKL